MKIKQHYEKLGLLQKHREACNQKVIIKKVFLIRYKLLLVLYS